MAQPTRIRDLGVEPGIFQPGPLNTITDVAGVAVGHRTLIEGDSIRTGVTAIRPHGGNLFQEKVPAAVYVGNGFGKAAGFLQVQELGTIEAPIVLTNTLSVGTAVEATVAWMLRQPGNENVGSVNAVVGETNDGYLNDIRGQHVAPEDVWAAIDAAVGGPVEEGSVGAGTGTTNFGWKGGIGTASRVLPDELGGYTLGALVQTNYGGLLRIDGVPIGEALGQYSFRSVMERESDGEDSPGSEDEGSCMIVLATDAPLSPRNLERIAKRAIMGLARTGSFMSNGTGDFVIAFSTPNRTQDGAVQSVDQLANRAMSPLFLATVEAVEEAVYNALTAATTVRGRDGHVIEALPLDRVETLLREAGRIE
jgi:D-aminopeptidase